MTKLKSAKKIVDVLLCRATSHGTGIRSWQGIALWKTSECIAMASETRFSQKMENYVSEVRRVVESPYAVCMKVRTYPQSIF